MDQKFIVQAYIGSITVGGNIYNEKKGTLAIQISDESLFDLAGHIVVVELKVVEDLGRDPSLDKQKKKIRRKTK